MEFDDDAHRLMAEALRQALYLVQDRVILDVSHLPEIRTKLSKAIVQAAEKGERDCEKLARHAFNRFTQPNGKMS